MKLIEKALAERQKNLNPTAMPTMNDLRWSYARSLLQAGRKEEALKLAADVMEETKKSIAEMEALPEDDPNRRPLAAAQRNMRSRYWSAASLFADAGEYQKAQDYLNLVEQGAGDNVLNGPDSLETRRADIYAKMGRPDLALEGYARSFASRMDIEIRDKIVRLAAKTGNKSDDIFARARQIRNQGAVPVKDFELKTVEGTVETLGSIRSKAKVTLVNFFHPT
jgi:tetratricopeptide (TPR) repeat protein